MAMNRRDFLRNTTIFSIGSLLLPAAFMSACRKETWFEDLKYNGKVIIIGAGAAGLYAAFVLKSKGIDFEILEASSVYGGRLGKITGFADYPLDKGAQWLHGKNNIVADLVGRSGVTITLDDSEEFYWFNNQIVSELPQSVDLFGNEGLTDVSFKEYAHQQGLGAEYDNIIETIAGDYGAAASRISALGNYLDEENWTSGDEDFKFRETYFDVIDSEIASKVSDKIRLNTPVTKIDYSQTSITLTDANSNTYTADKVIVTVPITILQQNTIQFVPALPAEKTNAISKIGMGAGMKVFLKFSSRFYRDNIAGGSVCAAYAAEHIGKSGNDNVLLAFVMGEQAENLTALGSDAAITNALLQELDAMYGGQATATFLASHVENFTTHPYILGAYSYCTVNMGDARKVASQSVDNKIFFAGEAMNTNGHHQTVFGAAETGYNAVIELMKGVEQ